MPIYEFRCRACGSVQERIRPLGDSGEDLACEACGSGRLERVPSTFAAAGSASKKAPGGASSCGAPGGFG